MTIAFRHDKFSSLIPILIQIFGSLVAGIKFGSHELKTLLKVNLDAAESRHPGLLGAVLDLPEAGTWSAEIRFAGSTTPAAFPFKIEVQPRLDPWIEYARALSLPVLGTLLFIWHQRRVFGKKPAGSQSQDGRRSPHP